MALGFPCSKAHMLGAGSIPSPALPATAVQDPKFLHGAHSGTGPSLFLQQHLGPCSQLEPTARPPCPEPQPVWERPSSGPHSHSVCRQSTVSVYLFI